MTLSTLQTHDATDGAGVARWTEETIAALIAYWQAGASAGTISKRLTAQGTIVSRSAVLGQVSRLRAQGVHMAVRAEAPKPGRPRKQPLEIEGCRWPIGDPGEESFHFCCAKPAPGRPYCESHCAVAYRPREELAPRTGGFDIKPVKMRAA